MFHTKVKNTKINNSLIYIFGVSKIAPMFFPHNMRQFKKISELDFIFENKKTLQDTLRERLQYNNVEI